MILEIRYTADERQQLQDIRKRFEAFKTPSTIDVCIPTHLRTETLFDGKQSAPWVVFSRNKANFAQSYFYEAILGGCLYARTAGYTRELVEVASEAEALARCGWHMAEELNHATPVPSWARTNLSRHSVSMAEEMAPIWADAAKRTLKQERCPN